MLNYRVDARLLEPYVPRGTELYRWQGHPYLSIVGFLFQNTRVLGIAVPCHVNFEEVNLRFHVRREVGGELRRVVTFIREMVPRAAIATLARGAYYEPYLAQPMLRTIDMPAHTTRRSSSPSISGDTRAAGMARPPSIGSSIPRGGCGACDTRVPGMLADVFTPALSEIQLGRPHSAFSRRRLADPFRHAAARVGHRRFAMRRRVSIARARSILPT